MEEREGMFTKEYWKVFVMIKGNVKTDLSVDMARKHDVMLITKGSVMDVHSNTSPTPFILVFGKYSRV